jgi:PAS domain S-box-containing protein
VAFITLSRKGIIERANIFARQLLTGTKHVSLVGTLFSNHIEPEYLSIYFRKIKNQIQKEKISFFDIRLVDSRQRPKHVHMQIVSIHGYEGGFSHWHVAFFDVTESHERELRLKEIHGQLEMASQAAELGVWNYDMESGTSTWNEQLYRLLGLEPRKGPEDAERFFNFIHPEDRVGVVASLDAILSSKNNHIREDFRILRADGRILWLAARGKIFRDSRGRPVRISGINYDITERKQTEDTVRLAQLQLALQLAETERVNEELAQYAYAVSHDLKGPLRALRNYADFLFEDLADSLSGDQKKYIEGMKTAVDQGDRLINDLLDFSRLDKVVVEAEPIDLSDLVTEIRSFLNLSAEVQIVVNPKWPALYSDRTLLKQILQNLISNAVKFNHRHPKRIQIVCQQARNDHIEISVRDNGIGIASQYQEQIFRIFQRLHTDREYEGTGIGLAIVQKAAQKIGGLVRLESVPGKGSTFYLRLPSNMRET